MGGRKGNKAMKKIPKILLNFETAEDWGRCLARGVVKYATIHGPWSLYQPTYYYNKPQNMIDYIKEYQPNGRQTFA